MDELGLLPGVREDLVRAAYQNAPGNEIDSHKFVNPESSAALVANTFGYFMNRPERLPALTETADARWPALCVVPEATVHFPWSGGHHPCLDVLIPTGTCLFGIESKRYEPHRGKPKPHFSDAYRRDVWGSAMKRYEHCRDLLCDESVHFQHLDASQLVKHAFGLRSAANHIGEHLGKRPILVYIYAEPVRWPDGRPVPLTERVRHRDEVEIFARLVAGDEVTFCSCTYASLLATWVHSGDAEVMEHAENVAARFML